MLENQIRQPGLDGAGWRVFVQEMAFISVEHTQEFRFGIVRPIPAFHRKPCIKSKVKTPADSYVAGRLEGERLELNIALF